MKAIWAIREKTIQALSLIFEGQSLNCLRNGSSFEKITTIVEVHRKRCNLKYWQSDKQLFGTKRKGS